MSRELQTIGCWFGRRGGFGYRLSVFVGTVVFARIETAAWDLLGAKLLNFFACA